MISDKRIGRYNYSLGEQTSKTLVWDDRGKPVGLLIKKPLNLLGEW